MEETQEERLAEYLRLEYGESLDDPDSVKASDLTYVGEFVVDGFLTRYWSFPTSGEVVWATIQIIDEIDCAGMTTKPPPGFEHGPAS